MRTTPILKSFDLLSDYLLGVSLAIYNTRRIGARSCSCIVHSRQWSNKFKFKFKLSTLLAWTDWSECCSNSVAARTRHCWDTELDVSVDGKYCPDGQKTESCNVGLQCPSGDAGTNLESLTGRKIFGCISLKL